ncbi:hypothetical protein HYS49_01265 [Candidatus Woesearchaeota archaeon]|nr:hypothetical protein [Candidatus Woesearchaeota archaeon]
MAKTEATPQQPQASKEERIGFHKGSLATLSKEREELLRILQIVEQLMQMHVKELKNLGVDLMKSAQAVQAKQLKGKKPIEDVLR